MKAAFQTKQVSTRRKFRKGKISYFCRNELSSSVSDFYELNLSMLVYLKLLIIVMRCPTRFFWWLTVPEQCALCKVLCRETLMLLRYIHRLYMNTLLRVPEYVIPNWLSQYKIWQETSLQTISKPNWCHSLICTDQRPVLAENHFSPVHFYFILSMVNMYKKWQTMHCL